MDSLTAGERCLQHWPHAAAQYVNSAAARAPHTGIPAMPHSTAASPPMHESNLRGLTRIHQGKVRDIYADRTTGTC